MRQTLSEFDEAEEGFEVMGEARGEEMAPGPTRRLPALLLGFAVMALFVGGLWVAYVAGTHHPSGVTDAGVPLIRAETVPSKIKPEQPGGMKIPDQNVAIYNEKPGGPPVENLLPAPEQPLPRPVPEKESAPPAPAAGGPSAPAAPAPAPGARVPAPTAAAPVAAPPPQPAAAPSTPSRAEPGHPIRVRLAALRSVAAAREEWARAKRDFPDVLGRLSGVAVRVDLGEQGIFYRVEAGPFADAAAAERVCGELKRHNQGCILAR